MIFSLNSKISMNARATLAEMVDNVKIRWMNMCAHVQQDILETDVKQVSVNKAKVVLQKC